MSRRSSRSRTTTTTQRRRERFDLSHLSPEDAQQTLEHLVRDLCFWGDLKATSSSIRKQSSSASWYFSAAAASPVAVAHNSKATLHRQRSNGSGSYASNSSSRSSSSSRRRPPRQEGPTITWKTATDALTGQTYYYDALTRVTTWEKVRNRKLYRTERRWMFPPLGRLVPLCSLHHVLVDSHTITNPPLHVSCDISVCSLPKFGPAKSSNARNNEHAIGAFLPPWRKP
jgi:hypothetical protein